MRQFSIWRTEKRLCRRIGDKNERYDFDGDNESRGWMIDLFKSTEGKIRRNKVQVELFHTCLPESTQEVNNSAFPNLDWHRTFIPENFQSNKSVCRPSNQVYLSTFSCHNTFFVYLGEGSLGRTTSNSPTPIYTFLNTGPNKCVIKEIEANSVITSNSQLVNNNMNIDSTS